MTYTVVSSQQSLFDIAVDLYGDVQAVHWLLADNRSIISNLTERLVAGQVLSVRDEAINPRVARYLNDFTPKQTIDEEDRPQGIGFWRLDEYLVQ